MLKELRSLDATDAELLQQFKYTLTWAKGDGVAPTAPAFLERAKREVGEPRTYAARKAAWRERVGYGPRPMRLAFTLRGSRSEIARAMMGDTELDATIVSHTVVRFGIEHPVARDALSGEVRVSFSPPPGTPATLRVHRSSGVAVVHGEIRVPSVPKAFADECPIRFAAPGLVLDFPSRVGLDEASVSFLPVATAARISLRESAAAARVFRAVVKERAAMEIVIGDKSHDLRAIETSLGPDDEGLLNLVAGFEWAELVARDAGIPDEIIVERREVERHLRALCLWAVYGGVASAEDLTILFKTNPMVPTHRPLITVTTAALRLSGWVAARVLAFRDPAPTMRPGSIVAVRPQPHSSSPSRAVVVGRASELDVLAMATALEELLKPLEPSNSVLIEDHEHIQKIWNEVLIAP